MEKLDQNSSNKCLTKPKTPKIPFQFITTNNDVKCQKNTILNQKQKQSSTPIKFQSSQKKQEYSNLQNHSGIHQQQNQQIDLKQQNIEDVKIPKQINLKQEIYLKCIKKRKVEYSPPQQNGNEQKPQLQKEVDESLSLKPCALDQIAIFLGTPGVGKTFLMQKLFQTEIIEFKQYNLKIDDNLQYNFVDTMGFDFENDYDEREIQIKHYQDLFFNYPKQIGSLFIVVNFERTDLMKKKLMSIYKFFRKFQTLISIIVTDINLSDDENSSQIDLQYNFKVFNPHTIIFIRRDIEKDELIEKLRKTLIQVNTNHYFDLTDTIFEKENEDEVKQLQERLIIRVRQ